jgi:hypothetical protein
MNDDTEWTVERVFGSQKSAGKPMCLAFDFSVVLTVWKAESEENPIEAARLLHRTNNGGY